MKKTIQMVVFDMAGTTVDEGKIVYKSVQHALNQSGIPISFPEVLQIGGWNKKEGIRHLMGKYGNSEPGDDQVEQIHDQFLERVNTAYSSGEGVREMEGASELFRQLHARGIKVVLDTGYHRPTANILIGHMGWEKEGLIDYSVTSDEVEKGRPHPFMIQRAMAQLGIEDPETIAKVGDTLSDIEEGKNAGCGMVVAMATGAVPLGNLIAAKPDHVIESLSKFLPLLD